MEDGRLGVIDFGFMLDLHDSQWELFRKLDRPQTTVSAAGIRRMGRQKAPRTH